MNASATSYATASAVCLQHELLAFDVEPQLAALGLIAELIPTTLAGQPFWNEVPPTYGK